MDALEASPMVASESIIGRIPVFTKTSHTIASKVLSSPRKSLPSNQRRLQQLETNKAPLNKYLKSQLLSPVVCSCPHIIAADDDPFQHLYYQNLFQKSIDFDQLDIKQIELKYELCHSGEELLAIYNRILQCECKNIRVIITDYHMGDGKLNGYETAVKLREAGYRGHLLLRTSETRAGLLKIHPDMDKVITFFIEKGDAKSGKEVLMRYLKERP